MSPSKKRIILVHGFEGSPSSAWLPWLKDELEAIDDVTVVVPEMPNSFHPVASDWVAKLSAVIGAADENTYLVGHSLGCAAILRYIESLPSGRKIGGALLVAGFAKSLGIKEHVGFFDDTWNTKVIAQKAKRIVTISSDNDPYVPRAMAEELRDSFGAKLIILKGAGHINRQSGHSQVPEILSTLRKLAGI